MTNYPGAARDPDVATDPYPDVVTSPVGGAAPPPVSTSSGVSPTTRPDGLPAPRPDLSPERTDVSPTEGVKEATSDVAHTARREAGRVAEKAGEQARRVVQDAKIKAADRLDSQQKQWSGQLSDISRELREMTADRADTPARQLVAQLADRSSSLADYLQQNRARDMLDEVQAFARRRPGAFLLAMAAAGFVAGRLGKGVVEGRGEGDGG
jgi:hypothetical protein